MREVVRVVALNIVLQKIYCTFFQILQQDDVVFTNLVIELSLEVVVSLEVTRTHPEGFFVHFIRHNTDELYR